MQLRSILLSVSALALFAACGNPAPKPAADAPSNSAGSPSAAATPDNKAVKAMVTKMGELADTLETVKDEDSARAAAKKIADIGKDMETLANKVDGGSAGTKMSVVMQANSKEFRQTQGRLVKELARLAITKPELMEIVGEEMDKLDF